MTSKIKVDNVNKVSDDSNIIKKCGTTTTIGSGASNPIVVDGSAVTLGRCGGTVALASGATQTGVGRTGTVDWQTGSIKTSTFTAANGEGYFADTSSGAFVMNLPSGTAGNIVSVVDYTNTFQTNNLTVTPNGSQKIGGVNASFTGKTEGQSLTWVYVDDTEGWKNIQDSTSNAKGNAFVLATGGTESTCGNCKIHTFTGPGTFTVTDTAVCAANNTVSHLIVAGGGAGATYGTNNNGSGGGGGGGFREVKTPVTPYTASPLDGYSTPANRVTVTAQAYPIVVGAGGAAAPGSGGGACGSQGSNSSFGGLTSAGGGAGSKSVGVNGGSGGGAGGGATSRAGGTGNTPSVTPAQGFNGGGSPPAAPDHAAGGGGGATEAGVTGGPGGPGGSGRGGAGATTNITGSPTAFAGGGGGSSTPCKSPSGAAGSPCGTGSAGGPQASGATSSATTNRGGGSGGAIGACNASGSGGSGIVVIRYKISG